VTAGAAYVLIVDDDAALLEALPETLHLRMPGIRVDAASSAAAALDRIAVADYDAIITDIKMPGMDGVELLGRIREIRPDTPVLVITGHGQHDLAIQSLRGGAFDYLQKPVDREYVVASLQRAVQIRGLRRQVAAQQRALERHASALEQAVEARTLELRQTADRLRVLTESAAAIHSARDPGQILRSAADAARRLADGGIAVACCEQRNGGGQNTGPLAWEVAADLHGPARRIDGAHVAELFAAAAHRNQSGLLGADAALLGPGISWALAVPMQSRDGLARGAIVVGRHEPPGWAEELESQVGALARQAAVALENAFLYQRERGIAETLQRSLLPGQLPTIPGLVVEARYLPGKHEAVGGDWYDMFQLPSGHAGIAMGDVAGRGVWAAAVMGQLRHALRAFALEGDSPAMVGARLNRLIPQGAMATLLYLVLDPDTMEARYINLGHVPPLIITPPGVPRFLDGGAPPLGAKLWSTCSESSTVVAPGSTLLLYTDGLVETRGESIDRGLARLAHALSTKSNGDISVLLDHVLAQALRTGQAEDDVAVLALRPLPLESTRLALRLPANPGSLSQLRQTLRRWLGSAGLPQDVAFEIATACNEACANAIEHAYGPGDASFSFESRLDGGTVFVAVRDAGRWRDPSPAHKGLGLTVMRGLMDSVDVKTGHEGTTVQMQRRLTSGGRI
jgi:FixJ family two-component response regulator/anti-sigma regulatory factor (Ser/Thr protein kinase)